MGQTDLLEGFVETLVLPQPVELRIDIHINKPFGSLFIGLQHFKCAVLLPGRHKSAQSGKAK